MMTQHHNKRPHLRSAVTLLEFLLAVALSAVVLLMVASAIHVQLRLVQAGRVEIERAQLARAILQRIANDLRGSVYIEPVDIAATLELAETSAAVGDPEDETSGADESGAEDPQTSNYSGTVRLSEIPGLYGTRNELQLDISRLPRIDEYDTDLMRGEAKTEVPSDLKTVAWYVRSSQSTASSQTNLPSTPGSGRSSADEHGLFRRELGRVTTSYAIESGSVVGLGSGDAFAPEVVLMEFRYFDGTSWYTDWDSSERGGLPMAVEIAVALSREQKASDLRGSVSPSPVGSNTNPRSHDIYRRMVYLPLARPTDQDDANQTGDP